MKKTTLFTLILAAGLWSCSEDGGNKVAEKEEVYKEAKEIDTGAYVEKGNEIVKNTFGVLKKNLFGAISNGGVVHAMEFCNEKAYGLTDSLSRAYNAKIERVAVKYRNPDNEAKGTDIEVSESFESILAEGSQPKETVIEEGDKVVFYKPIVLIDKCVICHGDPEKEIGEETYAKIKELYPEDKAIGFKPGDLRGLWKITFEKETM